MSIATEAGKPLATTGAPFISADAVPVPPPPGPPPGFPAEADMPMAPPTAGPSQLRPQHPLPSKPLAVPAQVVISGEAQIRDLKAEATAFIPTALKRKRDAPVIAPAPGGSTAPAVNAAPQDDDEGEQEAKRPSLLNELSKAGISGS
jgi:hypothetical protein